MAVINLYLTLHLIEKGQYPPCLTEEEINKLINKPNIVRTVAPRDKAIMQTFYSTGIRNKELAELKITDIDFTSNLININYSLHKWKSQVRSVPIGKTACEYIQTYLKKTRPLFVKDNDQGYLFLFVNGGKMNAGYVSKIIRVNARKCGLKNYSLRITYAVHMHKNGVDINYLMQVLGFLNREKGHKFLSTNELKGIYFKCHPSEKSIEKSM